MKERPSTRPGADASHLRYVTSGHSGFQREKYRSGFRYRRADGRELRDPVVLERIRHLAIPPAWTNVWICASEHGHLRATGRDARGRKQYRYHPLGEPDAMPASSTACANSGAPCLPFAGRSRGFAPAAAFTGGRIGHRGPVARDHAHPRR